MATKRKKRNAKGDKPLKQKKKKATPPPTPKTAAQGHVPTPAQVPLQTAIDVRREQAKLYREMRGGALEHGRGTKLVWTLGEIRRTIETEDVEAKLNELREAAVKQGLIPK